MYKTETFKQDLTEWFNQNQREMPWRETTNPYYIWISEVMLQQTQVDTVRSYYQRFIERFPTLASLANAKEEEVLKYWEGLGYYSRARNFHTAVKTVVDEYHSEIPKDPEAFKALKGVGPYTQAAVLSIAFDVPLPTVDGNVFRVWSRLNNDFSDIGQTATRRRYEAQLTSYVWQNSGTFNQAMMELGALVCTPKNALCLFCPVSEHCEAYREGTVQELPVKRKKVKKEVIDMDVYVIKNEQGQYLIEQRTSRLLKGMWQFPMFESNKEDARKALGDSLTIEKENIYKLKHQFTHKTWNLTVHQGYFSNQQDEDKGAPYQWIDYEQKENYSFPVAMTKIFESL